MDQPISLTLRRVNDTEAIVLLSSSQGQAEHQFTLPWLDTQEWNAVYSSLEAFRQYQETWFDKEKDIALATRMKLTAKDGAPLPQRIERVGSLLYKAIFGNRKIEECFKRALYAHQGRSCVVELHLSSAGSYIQTYPWEILHDGDDFLFGTLSASLVRYIDFGKPLAPLKLKDKLGVLLVEPRPEMTETYNSLPILNGIVLKDCLFDAGDRFKVRELASLSIPLSTLGKLPFALNEFSKVISVVHIDAHGGYGLLCEKCARLNVPGTEACPHCSEPFSSSQQAQGYLAFEEADGSLMWVNGELLGKTLANRNIQLVVLSACNSGLIGGRSVFSSVAGALIKYGIPSVVAMQFSVEAESTKAFTASFYQALVKYMPLTLAIANARTVLLSIEDAWYRPVLYLRRDERNPEGRIFNSPVRFTHQDRVSANPVELLAEIAEWKKIHRESQSLWKALDTPITFLRMYRQNGDSWSLREASDKWRILCRPKLKAGPAQWNFQYVYSSVLDELYALMSSLDEITGLLGPPDIQPEEAYNRLLDLQAILFEALDVADKQLERLIERLKPIVGE